MAVSGVSGFRGVELSSLLRRNCRGEHGNAKVCPAGPNAKGKEGHSWVSLDSPGDESWRCTRCGARSVYRATLPIEVRSDRAVNELFCGYADGYRDVYNKMIRFLCGNYQAYRVEAQAGADRYADSKKYDCYMATKKDMDRAVADKYDLNRMITVWRRDGVVSEGVCTGVQRKAAEAARMAFLARYDSHRDGIYENARLKAANSEVRKWNRKVKAGEAGEGAKKKRVRHPSRATHRKAGADMSNPEPMLYPDELPVGDKLWFGSTDRVASFDEETAVLKVKGIGPRLQLNRTIAGAENLDLKTAQFFERTPRITSETRPWQRTWSVRLTVRCLIPEAPSEDDYIDPDDLLFIDPGCINQIATSEGDKWSGPSPKASNRKISNYQREQARCKNGSPRQKKLSRKEKKEHKRKTSRREGSKAQKSSEIAKTFAEVCVEANNHVGMRGSGQGTIADPGSASKTALNYALADAAMGETERLIAAACHNNGALFSRGASHNNSVTCSRCGHIDKDNRPTRDDFVCVECAHDANADVDAAVVGKQKRLADKQKHQERLARQRERKERLARKGEKTTGGEGTTNPETGEGASSGGAAAPRRVMRQAMSTAPRADEADTARTGLSPPQDDSQPASPCRDGTPDPYDKATSKDVAHAQPRMQPPAGNIVYSPLLRGRRPGPDARR